MEAARLILKGFNEVAERTRMFSFEKPEGFTFEAGQYVVVRIDPSRLVEPDVRGGIRSFSLASAPHEGEIVFVMREGITGFKKTMWDLLPGETISCSQAVGHCTVPRGDGKPIVLLAGGVGIAPARSILRDAAFRREVRPYTLFYSNRHHADVAFHEEILGLDIPNFRYVWTLSDEATPATNPGEERGHINTEMLEKYLPDGTDCHYYVIGSTAFADAMREMLLGIGARSEDINIDPFTGLTGPPTGK